MLSASLLSAYSPSVWAEPTEGDRQVARALAAEGYEALQRKDYATAEDRFRRADKLVHAPTLIVDLARSLTGLGRLVEAYEYYELVLREGVSPNTPWSWQKAYRDAERELEQIKPRLSWLTINVGGPRKPVVFIDGRRVPSAAVGVPRAVNPGLRMVAARARGFASKQRQIMVAEGQHETLELNLEPKPEGSPEEPEPVEVEVLDELPPPRLETPGAQRTIGYVALTVGGVGLIVGGVSSVLVLRTRSELARNCPTQVCDPATSPQRSDFQQDLNRYSLFKTAATVSLITGVVGVAAGTYLLFSKGGSPHVESGAKKASLEIEPVLGVDTVGVAGRF
ncbi:MAG TPA: hypothetical protein VFQ35_25015 [Polyangiaceae bacterium]|nr:hypothetical protein [Polyangiaceae bacterium]